MATTHDNRLALVTGTSSGIGDALARLLLAEGWTVVGMSRRPAAIDHPRYREFLVDLGEIEALVRLADDNLAALLSDNRWQRVGLVNNAATPGFMHAVEETDPRKLAGVLAVNTVAPVHLMGVAVRYVARSVPLRIVNVSSGVAVRPLPGLVDYNASKAALRLAGMTLAAELQSGHLPGGARSNVAIMSYSPGVVSTPMQEAARSANAPWSGPFVGFHVRGNLIPPEAPALDVVQFLDGDSSEPFIERRIGEP